MTFTNNGSPLTAWQLKFNVSANDRLQPAWGSGWSQNGQTITVDSLPWNGNMPTGGRVSTSGLFTYTGSHSAPSGFTLNGLRCNYDPMAGQTPVVQPSPDANYCSLGLVWQPTATGCSAHIELTNTSGSDWGTWRVMFLLKDTAQLGDGDRLMAGANGIWTQQAGWTSSTSYLNFIRVGPASWNSRLPAGATVHLRADFTTVGAHDSLGQIGIGGFLCNITGPELIHEGPDAWWFPPIVPSGPTGPSGPTAPPSLG